MKIYTTLNLGEFHTHNCEDFFVSEEIGKNKHLIAVLDGSTMGTESVFASMLYGKALRNIAKRAFYNEFTSGKSLAIDELLSVVIKSVIHDVVAIKNNLGLDNKELLSTLILGLIDRETTQAELFAVGDGLVCKDGELIEFDHDNKPDYLGYHLSDEVDEWIASHEQRLHFPSFNDLSICTDGIFTFKNLTDKTSQKSEKEIIDFLLINNHGFEHDNFLDKKIRHLANEENHLVTDDLAIVRVKKSPF